MARATNPVATTYGTGTVPGGGGGMVSASPDARAPDGVRRGLSVGSSSGSGSWRGRRPSGGSRSQPTGAAVDGDEDAASPVGMFTYH